MATTDELLDVADQGLEVCIAPVSVMLCRRVAHQEGEMTW